MAASRTCYNPAPSGNDELDRKAAIKCNDTSTFTLAASRAPILAYILLSTSFSILGPSNIYTNEDL